MAAPAGQPLEALVKDELRGPVTELVREQLNGHAPSLGPPVETTVSGPENAQVPRRRPGPTPEASAGRAALQSLAD